MHKEEIDMKKWKVPTINEVNISDTKYGSATHKHPDYSFKDQDGHIFYSYSGTGGSTNNRKDIVDPQTP